MWVNLAIADTSQTSRVNENLRQLHMSCDFLLSLINWTENSILKMYFLKIYIQLGKALKKKEEGDLNATRRLPLVCLKI